MARRSQETEKRRGLSGCLIFLLIVLILILAAFMTGSRLFSYLKNYNEAFDPGNTADISFTVPQGATTSTIGELLEEAGLIKNADVFRYKTKLNAMDGT